MTLDKLSLLSRLRSVMKTVKFMVNFNIDRWRLASIIAASSSKRRLSFNDRPGLRACTDIDKDKQFSDDNSGSSRGSLYRTTSYLSEDDIDNRAEMFIANFHRQLRIERQISLDLKCYSRGNSFEYMSP